MNTLLKPSETVRVRALPERGMDESSQRVGETGVVKARRIVDGSWIGYVVEFGDQTTNWFFEGELERV